MKYIDHSHKNLPTENYNTAMTLVELVKHPAYNSLKKGLNSEVWEIYKNVKFIDFLKDDKIQKGVKNYLTLGIRIFFFMVFNYVIL